MTRSMAIADRATAGALAIIYLTYCWPAAGGAA